MRGSSLYSSGWLVLHLLTFPIIFPLAGAHAGVRSYRHVHHHKPGQASLAGSHDRLHARKLRARQLETCVQSCGAGSETCGGEGTGLCYNPGQGQVSSTPGSQQSHSHLLATC